VKNFADDLVLPGVMSFQKPTPVRSARKWQYTAASREVQVCWGGVREWRKTEQWDWYTVW